MSFLFRIGVVRLVSLASLFAVSLATAAGSAAEPPVVAQAAAAAGPARDAEAQLLFRWFDTLGYPDVRGKKFVRIFPGVSAGSTGRETVALDWYGFLLDEEGDKFTFLTTELFVGHLTKKSATEDNPLLRIGYDLLDLAADAEKVTHADGETRDRNEYFYSIRHGPRPMADPAQIFIVAWAMDRNGLAAPADDLVRLAQSTPGLSAAQDGKPIPFREQLSAEFAEIEMWRTIVAFGGYPLGTRSELLRTCERIAKNYPESPHAERARATAAVLRRMIRQDEEYAARQAAREAAGQAPAELSKQEQIADLIFQLRDQHGTWVSNGEPDIVSYSFGPGAIEMPPPSAADRLVEFGQAAVPQLIAALADDRFSRTVRYSWRGSGFSHQVLTIGECAEKILSHITGFPYDRVDMRYDAVQQVALKRYADTLTQGELAVLAKGVERGDDNSWHLAKRLIAGYPDQAMPILERGIRNATRDASRTNLLSLLDTTLAEPLGDRPVPFLIDFVKTAPELRTRIYAAEMLDKRNRSEGVAAMLEEWPKELAAPTLISGPPEPYDLEKLAELLARSQGPAALAVLARDFENCPDTVRRRIIGAFSFRKDGTTYERLTEPDPLPPVALEILFRGLDDTAGGAGFFGKHEGRPYYDLRNCDLAALRLHKVDRKRYPFEVSDSPADLDRNLRALRNIVRKERGLPPLGEPDAKKGAVHPRGYHVWVRFLDGSRTPDEATAAVFRELEEGPLGPVQLSRCVHQLMADATPEKPGLRLRVIQGPGTAGMQVEVDLLDRARGEQAIGLSPRAQADKQPQKPIYWKYIRRTVVDGERLEDWSGSDPPREEDLVKLFEPVGLNPKTLGIYIELVSCWRR